MKSREANVLETSDYFIYTPSATARGLFFYPLYSGRFSYNADYQLLRKSYDSYLLMYIESGSMELSYDTSRKTASAGQFVLIDCYQEHGYRSLEPWSCLWLHFDGASARELYTAIINRHGNIFTLANGYPIISKMDLILRTLRNGCVVREALVSKYIYDILTAFFLYPDIGQTSDNPRISPGSQAAMAEESMMYISDHFTEAISVDDLAARAGLSTYHYIRSFKRAMGITPYQYLIHTRLNAAKYLLINTELSIKEICFSTGFTSESVFNHRFKTQLGLTPGHYRSSSSIALNDDK